MRSMRRPIETAAMVALAVGSGCASITSSEMQSLALTTVDREKKAIEGAACILKNDKGTWEAKSPSFVEVKRSAEDLNVECSKAGLPNGILKAISRATGGMFGNILLGGGIGAIIDHNTGTGYNYPDTLPVEMGTAKVVDRRDQDRANPPEQDPL